MLYDRFITIVCLANLALTILLVYSHIHMIKCIINLLATIEEIEDIEELEDEDE